MMTIIPENAEVDQSALQQKLALLIQHNPIAIIELNLKLQVISWNDSAQQLFGYAESQAIGNELHQLIQPSANRDHLLQQIANIIHQNQPLTLTDQRMTTEHHAIIGDWHCHPITDAQDRVTQILMMVQAVHPSTTSSRQQQRPKSQLLESDTELVNADHHDTEKLQCIIDRLQQVIRNRNRALHVVHETETALQQSQVQLQQKIKQTHEELHNAQQLLSSVLDSLPIPIFVKDVDTLSYVLCNPAAEKLLDLPMGEILGKTDYDLFPIEQADIFTQADWTVLESGHTIDISELSIKRCDRKTEFWHVKKVPISDIKGNTQHLLIIREDISDRKRAEMVLQESESQLKIHAEALEHTLQELKHTQAQLVHTEKMSALGQMAAGLAHEINNPINFIHGNLKHAHQYTQDLLNLVEIYQQEEHKPSKYLQEALEDTDFDFIQRDLPKVLDSMKTGTSRVSALVSAFRNFSRLDEADCKPVNIHQGIDSTLLMLNPKLKISSTTEIAIIKEYDTLPLVECYANQLNQVFLHLLSNAIDALQVRHRQLATVRANASPTDLTPQICITTQQLNPDWIEIQIADNGPGIDLAHQTKIFDPFFTTKPVGDGQGLGLSISYQIVAERHGGTLTVQSDPTHKTIFSVKLPMRQSISPQEHLSAA